MKIAKISSKGQIALPKELLTQMGVEPGDRLVIERVRQGLLIKPLTPSVVEATASNLKVGKSTKEAGTEEVTL